VCTPRGLIEVSWKVSDGNLDFQANVPTGIETKITMPDGTVWNNSGGKFEETFALV
jgi:hypothetical protein